MDLSNRGPQPASNPGAQGVQAASSGGHNKRSHHDNNNGGIWVRIGIVAAIFAVVILLVGLILVLYSNNSSSKDTESKYIYTNKLQAVFLNTGQVYFGNIKDLNNNFLVLTNIFYLQTSSNSSSSSTSSSNNNVTLVKLGCELHRPYDQMVINRSQVTFWENLQSNGQVAQAVATFERENPNGQQCSDQSSSASTSSGSVQPSSSTAKP